MLAAIADGMVQEQELELINQIQRNHPEMKSVPEGAAKAAVADIYNKLSAGMEPRHILEQLSGEFTKDQKLFNFDQGSNERINSTLIKSHLSSRKISEFSLH